MAKRSRRPPVRKAAPPVADHLDEGAGRPAGPRPASARRGTGRDARPAQRSFFDRFGGLLLVAFTIAGVAVVAFFVLLPGGGKAYACDSTLTPGPAQAVPSYVAPTPVPSASPTPSASPSPSSGASPSASPAVTPSQSPSPSPTTRIGFVTSDLGRNHILDASQQITYGFCPPDSGPHYNIQGVGPLARAFYPASKEQTPGGWVHNLEHGYVVIAYSCGADGKSCPSQSEMTAMQTVFDTAPRTPQAKACGLPNKLIVVRFDDMTTRFALISWDREYLTDTFTVNLGLDFAEQNIDQTNPEQGAC